MQTQAMKVVDAQQKFKAMLKEERWQEDMLVRSWEGLVGCLVDQLAPFWVLYLVSLMVLFVGPKLKPHVPTYATVEIIIGTMH